MQSQMGKQDIGIFENVDFKMEKAWGCPSAKGSSWDSFMVQDAKIVLVNLETSCFDEYGALLIVEDISYIDYLFLRDCVDIVHMNVHRFH